MSRNLRMKGSVENRPWDSKGEALGIYNPGSSGAPDLTSHLGIVRESWYALCTRLRWEKKIESALRQHQLSTYLPLIQERHHWSDRSKTVEVPLFPGYLFVRTEGSSENRLGILQIKGVLGFAGARREGSELNESEIENLRLVLDHGSKVSSHPFLRAGQRARICSGALQGVEGVILSVNNRKKLVISVELIQRSVAITCDGYEVAPCQPVPASRVRSDISYEL